MRRDPESDVPPREHVTNIVRNAIAGRAHRGMRRDRKSDVPLGEHVTNLVRNAIAGAGAL